MIELLSICIPTFNRAEYLRELLESINAEIKKHTGIASKFKIYISDNASTDKTYELCNGYSSIIHNLEYSRNEVNLGGDKNIFKCCTTGTGKYRWVMGDDELIAPDGLAHIIKILEIEKPGLLINNDGVYNSKLKLPAVYENFTDFAKATIRARNPHMLIAHSLITANIFLSKCFDAKLASIKLPGTRYAHMYGMVSGLIIEKEPIYVTNHKTIIVRNQRAAAHIDELPLISNIEHHWLEYINWIRSYLQLPDLDAEAALKYPSRWDNKSLQIVSSLLRNVLPVSLYKILKEKFQ